MRRVTLSINRMTVTDLLSISVVEYGEKKLRGGPLSLEWVTVLEAVKGMTLSPVLVTVQGSIEGLRFHGF